LYRPAEEEPIGLLAPEAFFKTASDVETAVMGTYADIASVKHFMDESLF
jgi:hypothetical protein